MDEQLISRINSIVATNVSSHMGKQITPELVKEICYTVGDYLLHSTELSQQTKERDSEAVFNHLPADE